MNFFIVFILIISILIVIGIPIEHHVNTKEYSIVDIVFIALACLYILCIIVYKICSPQFSLPKLSRPKFRHPKFSRPTFTRNFRRPRFRRTPKVNATDPDFAKHLVNYFDKPYNPYDYDYELRFRHL